MTRNFLVAAAVVCLSAGPLFAGDGFLIVQKMTTGGNTRTNRIEIEATRMRAEVGRNQTVIFDGAKQTLWAINDDRKTYTEMTKADVDRLGGQMTDAMAKMQEQMKNLPPDQRERMEAMMRGRGMPPVAANAKTEYRKVGAGTVGKWTCDKYEGFQNGQKTLEICTVDPKTLGLSATDFQVTKQLAEFFRSLNRPEVERLFVMGSPEEQGYGGVPVQTTSFNGGRPETTTEIVDVQRQTFPSSAFEVPAGYQKEASMMGGRGRARQ